MKCWKEKIKFCLPSKNREFYSLRRSKKLLKRDSMKEEVTVKVTWKLAFPPEVMPTSIKRIIWTSSWVDEQTYQTCHNCIMYWRIRCPASPHSSIFLQRQNRQLKFYWHFCTTLNKKLIFMNICTFWISYTCCVHSSIIFMGMLVMKVEL